MARACRFPVVLAIMKTEQCVYMFVYIKQVTWLMRLQRSFSYIEKKEYHTQIVLKKQVSVISYTDTQHCSSADMLSVKVAFIRRDP